jgi:WNK lysine deficient protein kinase
MLTHLHTTHYTSHHTHPTTTTTRLWLLKDASIRFAPELARQICAALATMHGAGIVHRDIKPDNIFITNDGDVRLGDFGLSCRSESDKQRTVLGTPEFMAPEIYEGKYSAKVDIYAVGLCVLQMVTGKPPFDEVKTAAQVLLAVTRGQVPEALNNIIHAPTRAFISCSCTRGWPGRRGSGGTTSCSPSS